jgi:hypothetical protein
MATYKFEQFENEMDNPTITETFVNGLHPDDLQIDVMIKLDSNGSRSGIQLRGVQVVNLDYNGTELMVRIWEHLNSNYLVTP